MDSALDCLVIGAGMAGLTAAHVLQQKGHTVAVIDKGRGYGGRMATRRFDGARFDHGAQFFTVRSAVFAAYMREWQQAGVVTEWSRGFSDSALQVHREGHARYRGINGMTDIPKHLARDLTVYLNERVHHLRFQDELWTVETDSGRHLQSHILIMTPPVPQTRVLLQESDIPLPAEVDHILQSLSYHPSIALLATLDASSQLPEPGAIQLNEEPIQWLADNHMKGISDVPAITVHAAPVFSQEHFEADTDTVARLMFDAVREYVQAGMVNYQIHRWRYSQPVETYENTCLATEIPGPLIFAGDIFGGSRVEGAFLSGLAAADKFITLR